MLVLAARGVWTAAEQHHQAMVLECGHVALPAVYTAFAGAHLAAAKGDAAAVAAVAPLLVLSAREAVDEPGFWPWQDVYAEALVDLGRLEEAERFLPVHEALAHERGRRSMIARLARARARLAAARGDDDAAQTAFVRSAELLGEAGMPYERALTRSWPTGSSYGAGGSAAPRSKCWPTPAIASRRSALGPRSSAASASSRRPGWRRSGQPPRARAGSPRRS